MAAAACLLGSLAAAPLSAQARGTTVFRDVQVVRTDRAEVIPGQTVVVTDGLIVEIGPAATTAVPRGSSRIEGLGRFLIPGLIELNGYLPVPGDGYRVDDVLLAYVARGVTTVGAALHASLASLKERVDRGSPVGPRILLVEPGSEALRAWEERDGAAPTRLPEHLPDQPDGFTPFGTLWNLTVGAARALGIQEEVAVATGARADLVLLDANPLEDARNLQRIAGVMVHGRWVDHADTQRRMEGRARGAIEGYYNRMPRAGIGIPGCTGMTLQDCFGGDSECTTQWNCRSDELPPRRVELLDELQLYGMVAPQSEWIAGQRVNFALKNDDLERAHAAAESCAAALWWCQALRGYVAHVRSLGSGEAQLDSAFANAPAGTPAWATPRFPSSGDRGLHCEWTDLGTLVGGPMLLQYERVGCGLETAFHKRFWWLSDPLWSVPGNERRSEHIVRNIQMRLHDEVLRVRRGHHPQEHQAQVIPRGLPNSWGPVPGRIGRGGATPRGTGAPRAVEATSGYVYGGYSFTPDERRFYDPVSTTSRDWALEWDKGRTVQVRSSILRSAVVSQDRMITRERWHELEHQTALLRRDGRLLVLAAARPPVLPASFEDVSAVLAMGRPLDLFVETYPALIEPLGAIRASAAVDLPPPPPPPEAASPYGSPRDVEWMASLEVVGDSFRARARHGAPAPALVDGFGLSDVVLVDERFEALKLPLLDAMLTSPDLGARTSVGLYFEVYGVERDETLDIRVSGERTNLSVLERVTGALTMRARPALAVSWLEAAETPTPNTVQRYLSVDLGGLEDGAYELVVTVQRGDGTTATASRVIRVSRR